MHIMPSHGIQKVSSGYGSDKARRSEPAISRVLFPSLVTLGRATIISLGPPLPAGSSNQPAPRHLVGEPSGPLGRKAARGLFGLAPGGVYRAPSVTLGAVSSYLTVSPLPVEQWMVNSE